MSTYEPPGETEATEGLRSIDEAASPSSQNSPEDPGKILGPIDNANFGGINSFNNISYEQQCPGSTCTFDNATWNDDTAQYQKADLTEILRIRNQAYNAAQPNSDTKLVGRQDSDPTGG